MVSQNYKLSKRYQTKVTPDDEFAEVDVRGEISAAEIERDYAQALPDALHETDSDFPWVRSLLEAKQHKNDGKTK